MSQEDWFSSWFSSPYYAVLYNNRDNNEAQAFINKLVAFLNPKPESSILDIACGEGRHAVTLARHGFDVTGIDISRASILKAHEKETDNLHFYIQDMRMPFHANYFDYAFNFFTSFGYFKTDREHELAAKNIAQSIKKGGTFVLDYFNINYVLQQMLPEQHIQRGEIDFLIRKKIADGKVVKTIAFTDPMSGEQRNYCEEVAAWDKSRIESIFTKAGLQPVTSFGDYNLNGFDEAQSPRLITIFKK